MAAISIALQLHLVKRQNTIPIQIMHGEFGEHVLPEFSSNLLDAEELQVLLLRDHRRAIYLETSTHVLEKLDLIS